MDSADFTYDATDALYVNPYQKALVSSKYLYINNDVLLSLKLA